MKSTWRQNANSPTVDARCGLVYDSRFRVAVIAPSNASSAESRLDFDSKQDYVLELLEGGKVIRTYKVALGQGGLAPKEREGDGRTPEGHYIIDSRTAESHYHKALHVSYPNAEDRKRAAKLGVAPGGAIMIHGLPNGEGVHWRGASPVRWTLGCIAVTDEEIDEIWIWRRLARRSRSGPNATRSCARRILPPRRTGTHHFPHSSPASSPDCIAPRHFREERRSSVPAIAPARSPDNPCSKSAPRSRSWRRAAACR